MSAIVCGKRTFFEELSSSPSVSKRVRFSSSPARTSPSRSSPSSVVLSSSLLDQLIALFPDMDEKVLERVLEESGDDLDLAIKSLNELRLGCAGNTLEGAASHSDIPHQANVHPEVTGGKQESFVEDQSATSNNWPADGAEWVELFVREMVSAANLDDARARAARALEALEKSICSRSGAEAAKNFQQQENVTLKEQVQLLLQENGILKRAVSIQHERQKEFDDKAQELQHLKQLVAQYQEQVRTLEVNNYALAMHLKQAQQGNSFPGGFNPDVF